MMHVYLHVTMARSYCMHSGFARTVNRVFDMFTCSGSYVTRPLVGKKRMLTDVRDVRL